MSVRFGQRIKSLMAATGFLVALVSCHSDDSTEPEPQISAATQQPDYIAIRVDAANFTEKSERWYLTNEGNIPDIAPDPDPPHFATAQGGGYLELLPDTRVSHGDELVPYENYWADTPKGPTITYAVDIPEPGRYFVWAKAYSTGTEDNGIHVGYDNQKPITGKRIQYCGGKNKWSWSSAQRAPDNHCGVAKTIYLDIPTAGLHNIVFYAREDGFELDQFILLKDPDDSNYGCQVHNDRIRCKNIGTGSTLGTYDIEFSQPTENNVNGIVGPLTEAEIDLNVEVAANSSTAVVGEEIIYTISTSNLNAVDVATSIKVTANLPVNLNFNSSSDCSEAEGIVTCSISELFPNDSTTVSFSATPIEIGSPRVDVKIQADQDDIDPTNDTTSIELVVASGIPLYDATLGLVVSTNTVSTTKSTAHLLTIRNVGSEPILNATLEFNTGTFEADTTLTNCYQEDYTVCTLDTIDTNQTMEIPVAVIATEPGIEEALHFALIVDNDENPGDNSAEIRKRSSNPIVSTYLDGEMTLEAEDFSRQEHVAAPITGSYSTAWFVNTELVAPLVDPDFDNTPPTSASANAYMELLPDTRTTNSDPYILGTSNFENTEESPQLVYPVFFNEAGVYSVNARIRANNDQDAGIHVGINGDWPLSSGNVTQCNQNGEWGWTNSTTKVTGECDSGTEATIEISSPGRHNVMVAAATDGVELDKLAFRLAGSDLPVGTGNNPKVYIPVEIDLSIASSYNDGTYTVSAYNPDPNNAAEDIEVVIDGYVGPPGELAGFENCTVSSKEINCKISALSPDSTWRAEIIIPDDAKRVKIRAELFQALDPNAQNNETHSSTGGGATGVISLLMLALFSRKLSLRKIAN